MAQFVSSSLETSNVLQTRSKCKQYKLKNFVYTFCIDDTINLVETEQINFDVIVFEGENRVVN